MNLNLWQRKALVATVVYGVFVIAEHNMMSFRSHSWLYSMGITLLGLCVSFAVVTALALAILWATGELPKKWKW